MLTFAASDYTVGSWLRRRGKLAMTRREAGVRGGLAKWKIIINKQMLTVAASDEVGGSWLRRRGRLASAAQEAGYDGAGGQ